MLDECPATHGLTTLISSELSMRSSEAKRDRQARDGDLHKLQK